ncbi:MAG: SRPBCC family protein [Gemmatimonadaceae bacterium]
MNCEDDAYTELVWRAFTDAPLLKEWLMVTDFAPPVGRRCTFRMTLIPGFDGLIACEVFDVQPLRRLVYTWDSDGTWGRTTLTRTQVPVGSGTRRTLTHSGFHGFRPFPFSVMMRSGWNGKLTRLVPALLRRLSTDVPSLPEPK